MSRQQEDIRHKFNRLTFYTLLLAFLGVSMTFIIFSSVGQATITCPSGQFVSQIGTASDKCGVGAPLETQVQAGLQPCASGGAATCSTTVTFSPAYSVTPQLSWSNRWSTLPSAATSSIGTATFLSVESGGAQWLNMPAAATEIFGDTSAQHQIYMRTLGVANAIFSVSCPAASITPGAYLVPQFSTDAGVTWKFLDSGTTTDGNTYHVLIDGSANANGGMCATPGLTPASSATANTFNPAATGNVEFRIIGVGGGGAGDSPVFTQILLQFFNLIPNVCYPSDTLSATSVTFTFSCTRGQAVTAQFRWKAYILA